MFDLLIKNGKIIDGTGAPFFHADVAVKDGKIVRIGKNLSGAVKVIDASGLCVTPGFFDSHSHSDANFIFDPEERDKLEQGVTTVITGQCGSSYAPVPLGAAPEDYNYIEDRRTPKALFDRVTKVPQGCNIAMLIGHGSLRKAVMGSENREPTPGELEKMKAMLRESLECGALGLSFGFAYAPGCFASTEEAVEFSKIVAEYQGVVAAHIRSEEDNLVAAVKEFIHIIEASGARGVLSHHKASGSAENWGKVSHTLRLIDEANARGCDIYLDVYPYTAGATSLGSFLPKEERARSVDAIVHDLDDPEYRAKMRAYIISRNGNGGLAWVKTTEHNPYPGCEGMYIPEIAKIRGTDDYDALLDLIRDSRRRAGGMFFTMCEEDVETVLAHPRSMLGTDTGNAIEITSYHPRLRGTFPRALGRFVREHKVTSLPEMIRKITSMPARVYGFPSKGLIWEGFDADICIFDEDTIIDRATYDDPTLRAAGFAYVIVGGGITCENAVYNGARNAKVLLRGRT